MRKEKYKRTSQQDLKNEQNELDRSWHNLCHTNEEILKTIGDEIAQIGRHIKRIGHTLRGYWQPTTIIHEKQKESERVYYNRSEANKYWRICSNWITVIAIITQNFVTHPFLALKVALLSIYRSILAEWFSVVVQMAPAVAIYTRTIGTRSCDGSGTNPNRTSGPRMQCTGHDTPRAVRDRWAWHRGRHCRDDVTEGQSCDRQTREQRPRHIKIKSARLTNGRTHKQ